MEKDKIEEILKSQREFQCGRGKNIENMTLYEIKDYVGSLENTKRDYLELLLKIKNTFSETEK
jgi:hypothetical protein